MQPAALEARTLATSVEMSIQELGIEILTAKGSIAKVLAPAHVTVRPVSIGSRAEIEVQADRVAPEHFFIFVREGRVLATGGDTADPATASAAGSPLKTPLQGEWVPLSLPCRVQVGEAVVRLFWCSPRGRSERVLADAPADAVYSDDLVARNDDEVPTLWGNASSQPAFMSMLRRGPLPPARPPPRRRSENVIETDDELETWTSSVDDATLVSSDSPRAPLGGSFELPTMPARRFGRDDTTLQRPDEEDAFSSSRGDDPTLGLNDQTQEAYDAWTTPRPHPAFARRATPQDGTPPIRSAAVRSVGASHTSGSAVDRAPPVFVYVAPNGDPRHPTPGPKSDGLLFQMATRAVDAWNRFVDDLDGTQRRPR